MAAAIAGVVMALAAASAAGEVLTGIEAYRNGDFQTAIKEFQDDALAGDKRAQYNYGVMLLKGTGVQKDVEAALVELEEAGWTVTPTSSGHRWGVARCGEASRSGCQVSIWSTPRSPGNHAQQLRRTLERCPHEWEEDS